MPVTALTWPYHLSHRAADLQGRVAGRLMRGRNRRRDAAPSEATPLQQLLALEEVSDMLEPARRLTLNSTMRKGFARRSIQ
jgi:hypothetical protein